MDRDNNKNFHLNFMRLLWPGRTPLMQQLRWRFCSPELQMRTEVSRHVVHEIEAV
jgi:hypothetical protein